MDNQETLERRMNITIKWIERFAKDYEDIKKFSTFPEKSIADGDLSMIGDLAHQLRILVTDIQHVRTEEYSE